MIKVKTFVSNSWNSVHHERLDEQINAIVASKNIEVVDIKYCMSTTVSDGRSSFFHSALLIYKEN